MNFERYPNPNLPALDDAPNSYLVSDAKIEDDPPELVIQHYPVPVAVDHLNKKISS